MANKISPEGAGRFNLLGILSQGRQQFVADQGPDDKQSFKEPDWLIKQRGPFEIQYRRSGLSGSSYHIAGDKGNIINAGSLQEQRRVAKVEDLNGRRRREREFYLGYFDDGSCS